MTSDVPERLSFPCDYPIKVMVRVENGVRSQVDAIVERHAGPIDLAAVTERPSTQGNFRSSGASLLMLICQGLECTTLIIGGAPAFQAPVLN